MLRIAVSLFAVTLVWLACPRAAFAATGGGAPLCDARGAITFAPPPTLEEPNASVDIGDAPQADDCSTHAIDTTLDHGRAPNASITTDVLSRAALSSPLLVMPATPTSTIFVLAAHFVAPRGVRTRVDRPPRV